MFTWHGSRECEVVPREHLITATCFVAPDANFAHYLDVGISSLAARVIGGTLVSTEYIQSAGRSGQVVEFALPQRVPSYVVFWSEASIVKHRPLFNFLQACSKTSAGFKCAVRFQMLSSIAEVKSCLNPSILHRFKWVLVSAEKPHAAEVLGAILRTPSSHEGIRKALIGASDFVRMLGVLRSDR